MGASPISEWTLRLYSYSTQACVASLSAASVRSGTSSSMAMSPALDRAPERLLLGILVRAVGQRGLVQDAEAAEPLGDLGGRHGCAIVAQAGTRQAALLKRL